MNSQSDRGSSAARIFLEFVGDNDAKHSWNVPLV
jgi:hypothetical protein